MNRLGTAIVVIALLAVVPASGAAQSANNSTSGSGVDLPEQTGTQIQDGLTLLSSSYNQEQGTVTLTFRSDSAVAVTLADAGAFMQEGEINRRAIVVNGKTKVEFAVTEQNGFVGVSISTDETLYGHPIKVGSTDFVPGGPSPEDTWLAGSTVFVLFAVALPGAFYANRKLRGVEHDQH
ncbi:hypothetical protein [Halosimplex pelagicum]|uniref:Uncharacterized protein n=1 Tax=Halosimplex pelagicum TaxID=869886 RepID=A0A7D5PAI5_9EURY|nr:hypothetical protein [Halosimplex pelagicum]QLH83421.1 hypothetical protein HZS54_18075 [Halosimplex pelagicum]